MRRLDARPAGGSMRGTITGPRTGALPVLGPMRVHLPYARSPRPRWPVLAVLVVLVAALGGLLVTRHSGAAPGSTTAGPASVPPATVPAAAPATKAAITAAKPTAHRPATAPKAPPVPHRAIYQDGKLTLIGSVPDQATAQKLYAKAAAVVGAANVIDHYVIDPRVGAVTDGRVTVAQRFVFPYASAVLDPAYSNVLQLGYIVMSQNPQVTMVINGYTDATGDPGRNLLLSQARAFAVVQYYVARGIDGRRFVPIGHGQADPAASNDTDAGRAQNRRIEVTLLHLIG